MFWKKKPKAKKQPDGPKAPPAAGKSSRDQIIAQAKANAAAARADIGDDTLDEIRAAIIRKQNSPAEKAKQIIKAMDHSVVRDHLSDLLKEDKERH